MGTRKKKTSITLQTFPSNENVIAFRKYAYAIARRSARYRHLDADDLVQSACLHALLYKRECMLRLGSLASRVIVSSFERSLYSNRMFHAASFDPCSESEHADIAYSNLTALLELRDELEAARAFVTTRVEAAVLDLALRPDVLGTLNGGICIDSIAKYIGVRKSTLMQRVRALHHRLRGVNGKEVPKMLCIVKGGIGKHCLQLREESDMTQDDIAKKVGCSFATVSRWESMPSATVRTKQQYASKFKMLYRSRMRRSAKLEVIKATGRSLLDLV